MSKVIKNDYNFKRFSIEDTFYSVLGILTGVAFILFVVLSTPVYLFRQVVILLAKWFRPDLGEILNPLSAGLACDLNSGKPPRGTIVVTITATNDINEEKYRKKLLTNWIHAVDENTGQLKYPKFQQYFYQWLGFIFFRKTPKPFDINNHYFFHQNLGSKSVTKEQVDEFVEKLLNQPFHPERSPWEVHIVNNYQNEKLYPGQKLSLFILRIHHSVADGYSILSALVESLFEHPISDDELPLPKVPKRSGWELIYRPDPLRISERNKVWHQSCVKSDLIPIQKIKDIKNSMGVSFTSVLLSAISAGLYKNLDLKKRNHELDPKNDRGKTFCLSTLPLPGHNRSLTNHVTAAIFEMPTIYYPTPVARLHSLNLTIEETKTSAVPYICRFYPTVVGSHFAPVTARIMKDNFMATGLTNFPSIPMKISVDENSSVEVDFVVGALEGQAGMAISVLSFGESIRVNVAAEKGLMTKKELTDFISDVLHEINVLYELAEIKNRRSQSLHASHVDH